MNSHVPLAFLQLDVVPHPRQQWRLLAERARSMLCEHVSMTM
jgi:hypothetical protein